jgi:hypothetical protein
VLLLLSNLFRRCVNQDTKGSKCPIASQWLSLALHPSNLFPQFMFLEYCLGFMHLLLRWKALIYYNLMKGKTASECVCGNKCNTYLCANCIWYCTIQSLALGKLGPCFACHWKLGQQVFCWEFLVLPVTLGLGWNTKSWGMEHSPMSIRMYQII